MSALQAGRATPSYAPNTIIRSYPMKASTTIYNGGIVALNSGYAVPGATSSSLLAAGCAQETKVSGGVDGDTQILVHIGTFRYACDSAFGQSDVGALAYMVDDQTVSLNASGKSIAGTVAAVDGNNAWITIGIEAAIDNTGLTAYISSVANTSTPGGASLVGVFDTASLYTATEVESALAEVMKKANAADGTPTVIPLILTNAADGAVIARYTPGFAGKIRKLTASVSDPTTTALKATTLTAAIAGTPTTGGAVALTSANTGTLGAKIDGSTVTAANAFSSSQEITIACSSTTAFVEGEVLVYLFIQSA